MVWLKEPGDWKPSTLVGSMLLWDTTVTNPSLSWWHVTREGGAGPGPSMSTTACPELELYLIRLFYFSLIRVNSIVSQYWPFIVDLCSEYCAIDENKYKWTALAFFNKTLYTTNTNLTLLNCRNCWHDLHVLDVLHTAPVYPVLSQSQYTWLDTCLHVAPWSQDTWSHWLVSSHLPCITWLSLLTS